jgi:FtsX-like permease family
VIRLGLRLTLRGGREAVSRLLLLAAAVGLGTGLLLAAVSGLNAATIQNDATSWLWTGNALEPPGPATAGTAPLWWHISADTFRGRVIARVDVAATGASSPVPPGIPHDPGPGQYYASPALAALLHSTPADELAGRYPGYLAGTIGEAALPSPDSLVIVIGHAPAQLARTAATVPVRAIATAAPAQNAPGGLVVVPDPDGLSGVPPIHGVQASGVDLMLSVVALGVLLPVLVFIATATRLSAARRERRFAAVRLAGATRRQVSLIAAVESAVASAGGVAVGFGMFFLVRVPLSAMPLTGHPFFPAQMSLTVRDVLDVALGVPAAATVAARIALRRVQVSPLGVARRVTPPPPTAWRLVPLLAGAAELGFFVMHGRPSTVHGQVQAFFPGMLLVVTGLIVAGPWLTMAGARFLARRARRPGALIAARRLADDPRAGFRAVSGLVLALFVTTVAVSVSTTGDVKHGLLSTVTGANVLVDQLDQSGAAGSDRAAPAAAPVLPATLTARLRGIDGVTGIIEVHAATGLTVRVSGAAAPAGLVSCAQLASVPVLGRCPAGAQVAAFPVSSAVSGISPLDSGNSLQGITWPAADTTAWRLNATGLDIIAVATNGSQPPIELARTVLDNAYPVPDGPRTLGELATGGKAVSGTYRHLADVVILTSMALAGCTLATSIAAGLADRKRPFSMLRLTGARLATLRRVVVLESAVPLLAVAIVAIGGAFGASAMFTSAQMQHPLVGPGTGYYLITAAGIAASLVITAATFPLLRLITGPEVARDE